ncbi:MAG: oligosaccharide flippase family protein [Anaerolineales bacterium]|nr:oligosaccharide flippase family protein [Anaerolineales bacterium]
MIREFIKSSSVYSIPSFISQGLSFLLIPIYTRILSPSDYGFLDLVIVFATLVNLTIPLQISQGLAYFYGKENVLERKKKYSSSALWFTIASYSCFVLLFVFQADQISIIIMGSRAWQTSAQLGILYIWSNGIYFLVQNQFRWELRSRQYVVVNLIMNIVTTGASLWLAFGCEMGLEGVIIGKFIGNLVGIGFSIYWLRESYLFQIDIKILQELLVFSLPLVIAGISVWANLYIDRLMINAILTIKEVGIYGIGNRFSNLASTAMIGFQLALPPLIYNHYQAEETPRHISKILNVYLAFALTIFMILALFINDILRLMTTKPFYGAADLIIYLVPAAFLGQMYIFSPGLVISKKTNMIGYINLGGAIINLGLNLFLIPYFGVKGAAIATLLSNFFIFIALMSLGQKYYRIPYEWRSVIVMVATASIIIVTIPNLLPAVYLMALVIKLLGIGLFIFALNIFKVINFKTIKNELHLLITKQF